MAVEVVASASRSAARGAAVHLKDARKRIAALDQLVNDERDRLAERREQLGGIDFHTGRRD